MKSPPEMGDIFLSYFHKYHIIKQLFLMDTISHIKIGNDVHPIDAISVNGVTFTSDEKTVWNNKQDALTFDSIPTEDSTNPITSGGVYSVIRDNEYVLAAAINDLNTRLTSVETFDSIPTENSENPVKSGGLYKIITDNEETVATALNDLDERVEVLENGGALVEESDPVFAQSAAYNISWSNINNWNSKTSNSGTITGINMNGSSKGTSGTVNLGTVLTDVSFVSAAASVSVSSGVARISFTFDSLPTENSNNLVKSGDLYKVITENELVASTALNDLNKRLLNLEPVDVPGFAGISNVIEDGKSYSTKAAAISALGITESVFDKIIAGEVGCIKIVESSSTYILNRTNFYKDTTSGYVIFGETNPHPNISSNIYPCMIFYEGSSSYNLYGLYVSPK